MLSIDYTEHLGFQPPEVDRSDLIDEGGRMRTASLFIEATQTNNYLPMYSLRDTEKMNLPSAYLIYMSSVDEFDAATKLVGSMRHWRKLLNCTWFMEGVKERGYEGLTQWRIDMMDRDSSAGKRALMKQVKKGDTSAARKILDMAKASSAPAPAAVGRPPSKATKDQQDKDDKRSARLKRIQDMNSEEPNAAPA